jgi:endogenous inhibitor of DNA gyrase (YacG/DUF329 family)
MRDLTDKVQCPNCGKKGTWTPSNDFRPFCSERCKLIDLGDWAGEDRIIPGETINPDNLDNEPETDL